MSIRILRHILVMTVFVMLPVLASAQQYTGMSGLIHVPSADMDSAGDARIGAHYLDHAMLPDGSFMLNGEKYNTFDFYVSLTPFWWVEIGYTMTLFKQIDNGHKGYNRKDRYFSVKFNPLREGYWWPAVAIGSNDFISSSFKVSNDDLEGNAYFRNYYVAATKHFKGAWGGVGITASYRHFIRKGAKKWNGVVGGVTYSPPFAQNLRCIVEWTGNEANVGIDCLLWRHIFIQGSLMKGKYPSAGLCYKVNLF